MSRILNSQLFRVAVIDGVTFIISYTICPLSRITIIFNICFVRVCKTQYILCGFFSLSKCNLYLCKWNGSTGKTKKKYYISVFPSVLTQYIAIYALSSPIRLWLLNMNNVSQAMSNLFVVISTYLSIHPSPQYPITSIKMNGDILCGLNGAFGMSPISSPALCWGRALLFLYLLWFIFNKEHHIWATSHSSALLAILDSHA